MKFFVVIALASTLINSSFAQSKINVEERMKEIELNAQSAKDDYDVEKIARAVDNFIQDRCTARKVPPTLAILQDHVEDLKVGLLDDKNLPAQVKVSKLVAKHVELKFACVGSVHIKSVPAKLDRTFALPIPHESDIKKGFWSLRK